jgi:hypothetical protein
MRRRGTALVALAACVAALTVTACGRDDFKNDPRPPPQAEISIQVSGDTLTVSPAEFGAGIANFTIVNLGDAPTGISIDGPTVGESDQVAAGTTTALKMEVETGDYEASASDTSADPFRFTVGTERESANNDLLTP